MLAANFFDPIVHALAVALAGLHTVIPNYGWTLIVLALVVRLALWPLTNIQFKSMAEMQKVRIKKSSESRVQPRNDAAKACRCGGVSRLK